MWVWADAEGAIKARREVRSRADSARGQQQLRQRRGELTRISCLTFYVEESQVSFSCCVAYNSNLIMINCIY